MHLSFVLPELIVLALLNVQALANSDLDKRLVCVKDDLYDGFHNADPEDINPWCSSYLGIPEYTATRVGGTSRTTVITTDTTFTPYFTTTTVPSYLTTTTITLDALEKRNAAPAPTPAPALDQLYLDAPILQQCDESEANKSVIASVSSACSCLFVAPRTVDVSITKTVTRTESAIDYESTPIYVTRSSNATLTETVYPTKPTYNSTLPGTSGMFSTFDSVSSSSSSPIVSDGPAPSQNTSTYPPGLSTAPTSTDLGTPSSTSSASLSTQSCQLQDSLIQDGSIIAQRDGEQFQILCFTNFPGPTYLGLDQPTYRSCLQQCVLSNDGFSVIRCYGISFFPKRTGANCYLKDQAGVATPDYNPNYLVVSGILLQNSTGNFSSTLSSSSTHIPAPSSSLKSGPTGPTAVSSAPIPITNSTSPSMSPVPSVNGTIAPSVTPSLSFNVTSLPTTDYTNTPPDMTESGDPRSRHQSPSSGSSGFPIPSANVTSGSPIFSPNATISGFPVPTMNTTASGFPTPPANMTSGFPTPTGNETSGFPTPTANLTSSGFPTPSSNGTSGFPSPTINGTSSGFPTPSGNASTCLTTDWVTAYTTQEVCLSYVTVYTTTSAPPHSVASTRTITQTYTIEVNARQKRPRAILGF